MSKLHLTPQIHFDFVDNQGHSGILQECLQDGMRRVWIGRNESPLLLTQDEVAQLLPFLESFVKNGFFDEPVDEAAE